MSVGCLKVAVGLATKRLRARRSHLPYRFRGAKHLHYSLDVVSQHMQAHLGANVLESAREEVRCTHPVLQRAEDMLDGASSQRHRIGLPIEPALHRVKNALMFPSRDAPVVTRCAP